MDNVTKWTTALRSGEYTQTTGRLQQHSTGGYCCLGVLCDIYSKEHSDSGWKGETSADSVVFYDDLNNTQDFRVRNVAMPSFGVLGWAGFEPNDEFINNLAIKNDKGASFDEIATMIEDHIKEKDKSSAE